MSALLDNFKDTSAVLGNPCYDINVSNGDGDIKTVNVTKTTLVNAMIGQESEDDVDYGTDGEGNIDYDDWTMQRQAKVTDERWSLEWDDCLHWPPFSKYGKQWVDPWTLAALQLLVDGGHFAGDLIDGNYGGVNVTQPISMFRQINQNPDPEHMTSDDRALFDDCFRDRYITTHNPAYYRILKGDVLVLVHTWSKQWVISAKHLGKNKDGIPMTEEETEMYTDMGKMKQGVLVNTIARGNHDKGEPGDYGTEAESKTYTVTRTWTHKQLWDKSLRSQLPIGLKLTIPDKNPKP